MSRQVSPDTDDCEGKKMRIKVEAKNRKLLERMPGTGRIIDVRVG